MSADHGQQVGNETSDETAQAGPQVIIARTARTFARRYPELRGLEAEDQKRAVRWARSTRTRLGLKRDLINRWCGSVLWLGTAALLFAGIGYFVVPWVAQAPWEIIASRFGYDGWPLSSWPEWAATMALIIAPLGVLLAISLPRFLIRRGLRQRATCQRCGYTLRGIRLDEDSNIACSECQASLQVWPLERDEAGCFAPWKPARIAPLAGIWPLIAYAITLVLAFTSLFTGYGISRLVYRYQVYQDAKLARAWMPTEVDFNAVIGKLGPVQTANRRLSDGISEIKTELDVIIRDVEAKLPATNVTRFFDPTVFTINDPSPDDKESRAFTRLVLDQWIARGGKSDLVALTNFPTISVRYDATSEIPTDSKEPPDPLKPSTSFVEIRTVARLATWATSEAARRNDIKEFTKMADVLHHLSLQSAQLPNLFGQILSWTTRSPLRREMLNQLSKVATRRPADQAAWLDTIMALVDRDVQIDRLFDVAIEGELLHSRQFLARTFSDVDGIMSGDREEALLKQMTFFYEFSFLDKLQSKTRLRQFSENRDNYENLSRWMKDFFVTPRWERKEPYDQSHLLAAMSLTRVVQRFVNVTDEHQQGVIALRALIALERYRLQHNDYPASLAELPGGPYIDLYNQGKPLHYHRQSTPERPMFLLYSVGFDEVDHQGLRDDFPLQFIRLDGQDKDNVFSPIWDPPSPLAPTTPRASPLPPSEP